jgi:hypothetical protein
MAASHRRVPDQGAKLRPRSRTSRPGSSPRKPQSFRRLDSVRRSAGSRKPQTARKSQVVRKDASPPESEGLRRVLSFAGMGFIVIVSTGLLLAHRISDTTHPPLRCPPVEEAATTWTHVVEDLQADVPPRMLLGGPGEDPDLTRALATAGITRVEFQKAATIVLRSAGGFSDEVARRALAISFSDFPLPTDFEIPEAIFPDEATRSPALESARILVLALIARLEDS